MDSDLTRQDGFKIIRPFGPSIYHSTMNETMMDCLKTIAADSETNGADFSDKLAGNIAEERLWGTGTAVKEVFKDELKDHLKNFVYWEGERYVSHLLNKQEYLDHGTKDDAEFTYEFNVEPWINYQKANEFNPIHSHGGLISSVLYIDVPEEIAQEAEHSKSNMGCAGQIEFMFGSDSLGSNGTHKIIPKTGDILLFNAKLKHCVYPFKSDVTRISMSFNVGNINSSKPIPGY
jgi:hypothetical protein